MRAIRITVPEVHDGLGGVHRSGDVVSLPDDITVILVEQLKRAVYADGDEVAAAEKRATELEDARRHAELEAGARSRMQAYDTLPPEVRKEIQETGAPVQDVIADKPKRGRR